MNGKCKTDLFVKQINSHILPFIDYDELQASYDSDMVYAKGILNRLHKAMVTAYGSERLSESDGDNGFVIIPGVVYGRESGKTCLVLLELDLSSSGEHWGTSYLCKYGVIGQDGVEVVSNNCNVLKSEAKEINDRFLPYDYGYSATIPGDIHVNRASLPDAIKDVLCDFKNHRAVLLYEEEKFEDGRRMVYSEGKNEPTKGTFPSHEPSVTDEQGRTKRAVKGAPPKPLHEKKRSDLERG